MVDEAANITDSYTYDAWGKVTARTGTTANPYKFQGEWQEENTGLVYLRARWYDPGVGRFLSRDPAEGDSFLPLSEHRYIYAGDDPANMVDPSGQAFMPGGIANISLTMNLHSAVSAGSQVAARTMLKSFLLGRPPKDLGYVGEMILDLAIKAVTDTMLFGGGEYKNKGAFGTAAHQELKGRIQSYRPLPGFEIVAEPFFGDGGNGGYHGSPKRGDMGVDVLIKHNGKNILAFDLKVGRGYSNTGIAQRMKRIGTNVIQINIKVVGK
ncbi:MAG: RHS repeat-associated core domain-containing protein [Burkholderiales bacterium]|nr:MAG: RHS repeat-associated core domain-containing protein [Burkholderiales bacterium]